jgi:hypothetical protein
MMTYLKMEDNPDVIEDSHASGDEAHEDDTLLASKRHRRVDEDLIEKPESSPSGRNDDDANVSPPREPSREASAPPAPKRSSGFFADEDDLLSIPYVSLPLCFFLNTFWQYSPHHSLCFLRTVLMKTDTLLL